MKVQFVKSLIGILLFCLVGACTSIPSNSTGDEDTKAASRLDDALEDFRAIPALEPYFEEAQAIVIIPNNFRAGTGFGGAVGKGWLIENEVVSANVWHWQFLVGADLGFQVYQQILFLKDSDAVAFFKAEPFQFAGQANATALLWGASVTPSYNEGVALFTIVDGGLLLEGSVGMHSYHVFPIK